MLVKREAPDADAEKFSTRNLVIKIERAHCVNVNGKPEVPAAGFILSMKEISKVFDLLGGAFGFVRLDVTSKLAILSRILKTSSSQSCTIQDMCRAELLNGKYKGYESACHASTRLRWLLEFMQVICTMISDEENDHNMREIATAAYYQALAPHHPWLVRTAAGVALFAVPNKDRFLALLETDQASAIRDLRTFKVMSKPVLDSLFDFHEENGLNKL
mmetsp:Transcript_5855/g.9009  ORF Transcript_5855/g.9009 Transcript_5855/m.9009 type:complete len:217 (+) Transcript_5855:186-836(+)